jgi:hypothetical protein
LYEILEDGENEIFILLTQSYFYIVKSFEENNKYVTKIMLTLHYEYTPYAEYHENFDVQLNMRNEPEVKEWFSKIRPPEDDM